MHCQDFGLFSLRFDLGFPGMLWWIGPAEQGWRSWRSEGALRHGYG